MKRPPLPANEPARLTALRRSGLEESGADPQLDLLVVRAAKLFSAPIAAITLLSEKLQTFKASQGLGVPYTTREVAFCSYAILTTDVLVVLNAQDDPRFSENPLVLGPPGIRFYAGAPIFGRGHYPFGALCVIDRVTRSALLPKQLIMLRKLAAEVSELFG